MEKTGKSYAAQDQAFVDSTIAEYTSKFPSGLVIYWTVNNVLTMAQQYIIMRRTTVKTVQ